MKCSELVARLLCGLRSAYQPNAIVKGVFSWDNGALLVRIMIAMLGKGHSHFNNGNSQLAGVNMSGNRTNDPLYQNVGGRSYKKVNLHPE